jgi:hypothetical protein
VLADFLYQHDFDLGPLLGGRNSLGHFHPSTTSTLHNEQAAAMAAAYGATLDHRFVLGVFLPMTAQ